MKTILLVANVAKEHVLKFHIPTIKALNDNGWTVDVACAGEEKIPYCRNQYTLSYERAKLNANTFKGIMELRTIINNNKYDVVYSHTTVGGFAGRLAAINARKRGTKSIYLSHGYYFYKKAPLKLWLKFYPIERILAPITDAIITINDEDYTLAKKKFKNCDVYEIPGIGVDYSRLIVNNSSEIRKRYRNELGISENSSVLIYLAELHDNKNQIFLIDICKRLRDIGEDVYLVLPGIDHADGEYQKYAKTIGIEKYVKFLGWRDDIGDLYTMSDICTASSIREGFGLNLVEAMACGVPVVASENRGHSSIIKQGVNGILVPQMDYEKYVDAIKLLIHNEKYRESLINEGLRTRDLYGSDNVVERIIDILEKFVK